MRTMKSEEEQSTRKVQDEEEEVRGCVRVSGGKVPTGLEESTRGRSRGCVARSKKGAAHREVDRLQRRRAGRARGDNRRKRREKGARTREAQKRESGESEERASRE